MSLGNYSGHHYSKLSQINKSNVANLRVVFMASIGGNAMTTVPGSRGNEQSSPLVEDGFRAHLKIGDLSEGDGIEWAVTGPSHDEGRDFRFPTP